MSVVHFQCPSCQAPLRLENRALFVGRTFDCPDCHETLLIEAEGSTGVKAKSKPKSTRRDNEGSPLVAASDPSLARRANVEAVSKVAVLGFSLPARPSIWDRLSRRPAVLGWIVAALFAVILFVAVSPGHKPAQSEADSPSIVKSDSGTSASKDAHSEESTEQSKMDIEVAPDSIDSNELKADAPPSLPVPPLPAEVTIEPPRDNKPNTDVVGADEKPPVDPPKPASPPAPAPLTAEAVEAKLQQKIVRFDQSKPVAFVKVLDTLEELAGVPIVWDLENVDEQHLQKAVTLSLKQTTVAEILDTLLKQVRLERRTVEGKIELRPAAQKD